MTVSTRGRTSLPDIEDELLKARLQPLADRVLPGRAPVGSSDVPPASQADLPVEAPGATPPVAAGVAASSAPASRADSPVSVTDAGPMMFRNSGMPAYREPPQPVSGAVAAAERVEQTRAARGPRKGVEFLLPDRVVQALRVAAAQDGVTMSVKLLEVLRTAGYPVIDEDFVDLRRLPKR